MIIGHLPAGYLAATRLDQGFDEDPLIWWMILIGAVLPDLDLVWAWWGPGSGADHHSYITHDPTLWLGLLTLGLIASSRALIGLAIGGVLHMMLDTLTGPVSWGYGRVSLTGPLLELPGRYITWQPEYALYAVVFLEGLLCLWAARVAWRRNKWRLG